MQKTGKKLSEMSLEELWQLFPIFLTEYQAHWKDWYLQEEKCLKNALSAHLTTNLAVNLTENATKNAPENLLQAVRISHIGSTAIGGIWAKPIVDILVEIPENADILAYKTGVEDSGYICMHQSEKSFSFNKGYTENGFAERVFHVHLRYRGDNKELYFRDYLMEHTDVAKAYETLKLGLWKEYEHNRDGYTDAKTEFIQKYTQKAIEIYGDRYL